MGVFDRVFVPCPKCGAEMEWQTKAGPCCMGTYSSNEVPMVMAVDLTMDEESCSCGARVRLEIVMPIPETVRLVARLGGEASDGE